MQVAAPCSDQDMPLMLFIISRDLCVINIAAYLISSQFRTQNRQTFMDEDECMLVAHQSISKQVENQDDVTGSSRSIELENQDDIERLSTSMEVKDRCESLNYFSESAAVEQQNESTEYSECVAGKDETESTKIGQLLDTYMDVNIQIREITQQIEDMKKSARITKQMQAKVDALQAKLADLTKDCEEVKAYFQRLKDVEARVMSANDRSLNVQDTVKEEVAKAQHRDSNVQALEDKVDQQGKQLESKFDHERQMNEKIKILIKKYKNIKIENVRQNEQAEANLQVIKNLVGDLVVANQQRDHEMKQLKEFVAQLTITMQAHIRNEQLHQGFPKTGCKISPISTGATFSTTPEVGKFHEIKKSRSFHTFPHIESLISENDNRVGSGVNLSSSSKGDFQLPPLCAPSVPNTTTTTPTAAKTKKRRPSKSLKLHTLDIEPPQIKTHDNQTRRMSYPSIFD